MLCVLGWRIILINDKIQNNGVNFISWIRQQCRLNLKAIKTVCIDLQNYTGVDPGTKPTPCWIFIFYFTLIISYKHTVILTRYSTVHSENSFQYVGHILVFLAYDQYFLMHFYLFFWWKILVPDIYIYLGLIFVSWAHSFREILDGWIRFLVEYTKVFWHNFPKNGNCKLFALMLINPWY